MKPTSILHSLLIPVALSVTSASAHNCLIKFSEDGKQYNIKSEHFANFKASSSSHFSIDGKRSTISAENADLINTSEATEIQTPFGPASTVTRSYQNSGSPMILDVTVKKLKDHKAFTMSAVIHNKGDKDITLHNFNLLEQRHANWKITPADASKWLVTPLMMDKKAKSFAATQDSFKEVAIIADENDNAFLMGPIGPAEAHCQVEIRDQRIKAYANMDGVLVAAGTSRRSEEMIFSFEPTRKSIDMWTKWVAITHGRKADRGPVFGWCSWYDRTTKIDEAHVLNVTNTINEHVNTFGKGGIIQIDDGYQKMDGDWSANKKFPRGMAAVAEDIRAAGFTPGVWFAPLMIHPDHPFGKENPEVIQKNAKGIASFMNANPFHPAGANWLNPSNPKAKQFLFNIIKDARDRNFGYIKIDFNGIGQRFEDPTKTRLQIFRDLYTIYREAAGDDMYILSCLGQPTRGVIGFVDAARVGPDSHPAHFEKCLKSVLRFQIFDNVWWQNDPDVSYLATDIKARVIGKTPQGEGMWRTWHNVATLVGGTAMISEAINEDEVKAHYRNYEIMRPGSAEPATLISLGRSAYDNALGFTAKREYGDFGVYNIYNCTGDKTHLTLNFKDTALPLGQNCAVFDFWENKVISYTKDSYNTVPLDNLSSALVRITPIAEDRPTLVGSNLHLSLGATEIDNISYASDKLTVDLTSAGAQSGVLTFYSSSNLTAGDATNCKVDKVESIGDNLYQVHLSGRPATKGQTFSLLIQ